MEKFKEVTEEMRIKLRERLPAEAVKPHPTKSYLSSIKAIYVVERLNDVFGVGSWTLPSEVLSVEGKGMVVVRTHLHIDSYNIHLEAFGGNDNGGEDNKNFDLGDAYKGAVTDAFTKICSYLEIGIDVFKGLQTGNSNGNTNGNTNAHPAGDRSNFIFGDSKDETLAWVTDKEVEKWEKWLAENTDVEVRKKFLAGLKKYRCSKERREKISNALEVKPQ